MQEDKASLYASSLQEKVFKEYKVKCFRWPSNSPDLNTIELYQYYLKQKTTTKEVPRYRIFIEFKQKEAQQELEQKCIEA